MVSWVRTQGKPKHGKKGSQTAKESQAHIEWTKANTTRIAVKLNNNTDADIIRYLNSVPSKQGAIKEAIRKLIASVTSTDEK